MSSFVALLWHFAFALMIGVGISWSVGMGYFAVLGVIELVLYRPEGDE